jgi:glucokinase
MAGMILAGDVGGTKSNLALFQEDGPVLHPVFQRRFANKNYAQFEDLVADFRRQAGPSITGLRGHGVSAAGFAAAGALVDGRLHSGNLPWDLDLARLVRQLDVEPVVLLNDLTATAYSLDKLSAKDLAIVNEGVPQRMATKAVIAAGTGLGEAILFWDGRQHRIAPSEGGLADFAARTNREIQLLDYLKKRLPHVCNEEILSGRGFRRIHEFLNPGVKHPSFEDPDADAANDITRKALAQLCPVCVETLDLWTEAYGAEAGNLALRTLALGGVYVGGGIAPKILPKIEDGTFFRSFCEKTELAPVLARIPVYVILNEDAPMLGVAYQAYAVGHSKQAT